MSEDSNTPVSQAAREGWIIMPCPICNVGKTERCRDTLGKPHPSMHPERRVWSTFTRSGEREPAPSSERELLQRAAMIVHEEVPNATRCYRIMQRIRRLASTTQEPALDLHTRNEALEEAARFVENWEGDLNYTDELANAIRALGTAR